MFSLPGKPLLPFATLLLAACGGGGNDGSGGAGGAGGSGADRGLVVNAALGFTIVESPLANEAPVIGSALVTRDGDGLTDAAVTLEWVVEITACWVSSGKPPSTSFSATS